MSCIDLLFCTNQNTILNYGVVSIFDKCYHNIVFSKATILVPLPPGYIREVWNYSQAMWKILNIQYLILIAVKLLKIFPYIEKLNTLMKYIPNKKIKCDYGQPPWSNENIKSSLKQRS